MPSSIFSAVSTNLDVALRDWDRLSDWSNLYKKKFFNSKFIEMIKIGGMPYYIEY